MRPLRSAFAWFVLPGAVWLLAACGPASKEADPGVAEAPASGSGVAQVSVIPVREVKGLLTAPAGGLSVVNLWATWCPPCVAEMPELAEFYRETSRDKVRFVSLSYDDPENLSKVRDFHANKALPFDVHVLGDMARPEDIDEALGTTFGGALPTTFIFDAEGRLVQTWEGAITKAMLESRVKALLQ